MLSFRRLAIVNRGDPAMRLIRAVRDLNLEGAARLSTIAFFTDPDRHAAFVREADEALCLGPALRELPEGGRRSPYLDYAVLERALREARADSVWVGWGFVAEHAEFAELCARLGVIFVGPSAAAMRGLGDKIGAKRLAESLGVPVVPWSDGPVRTLEEARAQADRVGFPLMLKATAGGGGRGIRRVEEPGQLAEAFERACSEARGAAGDDTVFLERAVDQGRHVEVQVLGDREGTVWAVGLRDCTVQRRNQKLIEEAPSPALSPELEARARELAVRLARGARYLNAGTVEFLYETPRAALYFMEMNTRLQVEHPVTEATTGLDLVKLQLLIADGQLLSGEPPPTVGHAIEVRLNAEDADAGFAPAPGRVDLLRLPAGPGIRVDAGVWQGESVPSEFDSLIVKLIAFAPSRAEAIARLRRALAESAVAIHGGTTNRTFLLSLLEHPDFVAGQLDTRWLDRVVAARQGPRPHADVALIAVAIESYQEALAVDRRRFLGTVLRGRPRPREESGFAVELRHCGEPYALHVSSLSGDRYRLLHENRLVDVERIRLGDHEQILLRGARRHRVLLSRQGADHRVEVDGHAHRISRDEGGVVRAPAPGVVLAVRARPGDRVTAGESLVTLEAMKMELPVQAPVSGRVRKIVVERNTHVEAGAPLVLLEPEVEQAASSGERVRFSAPEEITRETDPRALFRRRCFEVLDELVAMVLGFDINPRETRRLLRELLAVRADLPDDEEVLARELELVEAFSDVLSSATPGPELEGGAVAADLGALLTGAAELPDATRARLSRLLAHYGVADLESARELEPALYWLGKAGARIAESQRVVERICTWQLQNLERIWSTETLEHDGEPARLLARYREAIDHLIASSHEIAPAVNALARQIRYRCFDLPLLQRARRQHAERMEQEFARLCAGAAGPEEQPLAALVNGPHPILQQLHRWSQGGRVAARHAVEVYLRRFYREQALSGVRVVEHEGSFFGLASYRSGRGRRIDAIAGFGSVEELPSLVASALALGERTIEGEMLLLDLVLHQDRELSLDELRGAIGDAFQAPRAPHNLQRICISARTGSSVHHLTFRFESGPVEEELFRGIHHMQAERLELWRLQNFQIERLPAAENVFLFRGVAHGNPRDRRLFAFADVREVDPRRDERGQIVELPQLERLHASAVAAIREAQYRSPKERLDWNRIYIYPWEPPALGAEELDALARRLALPTKGLGVEKIVLRTSSRSRGRLAHISVDNGLMIRMRMDEPKPYPVRVQTDYSKKVMATRRRGLLYPYEIVRMLTPQTESTSVLFPLGEFVEHDLDEARRLVPVSRPHGQNTANVVVGLITNRTPKHPEGMTRVLVLGDPSRDMGALAEPECRRIIAALDLAAQLEVPLEWFPVSSGAKISMESGTENLDWTARVLRRIVEFTEAGGEINAVVNGVNVGAQSYWDAEATMLMHTRGVLIMTPQGSLVLTGKRALDYSGSVSAEDNRGIGGLAGIMGPNGQAQYAARDITQACLFLYQHYELTYVKPGERFPRRARTRDPITRDISSHPHRDDGESGFTRVGEIFSNQTNPGRKKPFDIRSVLGAVIDSDHASLERWSQMRNAETAVVLDAQIGGIPVCLIGIESRRLVRQGFVPGDGPDAWTGATLYPLSSKKVARALNAASGNRPVVVLANLAGFDGSPESMRRLQLEYGAEIGRAVVRFRGPIVFCVICRYHGGAYVVFSRALNEHLQASALEGAYASVIGGGPAAAVVFPNEVRARAYGTPAIQELRRALEVATEVEKPALFARLNALVQTTISEQQRAVAEEFDRIHDIERARRVGSLDQIVPPSGLRPYLIEALERGIRRIDPGYPELTRR